jgi:hypothetical protein
LQTLAQKSHSCSADGAPVRVEVKGSASSLSRRKLLLAAGTGCEFRRNL